MKKYFIKQEDSYDCGACCLLSLIKYYKGFVPLEIIKVDTITNSDGTTFYNLKLAAIKYGFDVIGYRDDNLLKINIPCIAQLKLDNGLNHFVVIYDIQDKITIMDPSKGILHLELKEFSKLFSGYYLYLTPVNKIVCYENNNVFKKFIFNLIKCNKKKIIVILLISLILVGLSLFNTYFIKIILDNFKYSLIILFVIISFLKIMLNYIKNYYIAHLNRIFNIDLINNYLKKYFCLPFKYLQLKTSGDIISRIGDLNTLKDFLSKEIINIIIYFLFMVGSLIFIFGSNMILSLILIGFTIIYILISIVINNKIYDKYLMVIDSDTNFMDNTISYINHIYTIKNNNKVNYYLNKLNSLNELNNNNYFELNKYVNRNNLLIDIYSELCLVLILIYGFISNYVMGDTLIYILLFNYFSDSIKYYMSILPNLMYFKGVFNKLLGLYYLDDEDDLKGLKIRMNDINISNLSYSFNMNQIFNNFSINIKKGSKVLLIGDNGSGKSTLLNMLYENITDYSGSIYINNCDIKNISKYNLRDRISYVSQNEDLLVDSIINNIILDNEFNLNKYNRISKILELDSIYKKKCNGDKSVVRNNFSGGEKQRIILARALYKEFDILLLDESLSEVNFKLRTKIIKRLNNYYRNKTIIYVSHYREKNLFDYTINLTARKENNYVKE